MPDRGLLVAADARVGPVEVNAEEASWALAGVTLVQVTFEVSREAALACLPEDVSRPVPCYARLLVFESSRGPFGPMRVAALLVGGRHQLLPRNVLVDGLVDGPAEAVTTALGSHFRPGVISIDSGDSQLAFSLDDGDGPLASAHLPALKAIDPSMLRWDPWLALAELDGVTRLVEFSLRPLATEAFLSKGATITPGPDVPPVHLWRQLRNLNTVSACLVEGDLEIVLPRVTPP